MHHFLDIMCFLKNKFLELLLEKKVRDLEKRKTVCKTLHNTNIGTM